MRKFPIQYLILLVFLGTITELIARDPVMIVRCRDNAKVAFSENPPKRLKMMDGCDCPAGYEVTTEDGEEICTQSLIAVTDPCEGSCTELGQVCYPFYFDAEGVYEFGGYGCFDGPPVCIAPSCGVSCEECIYIENFDYDPSDPISGGDPFIVVCASCDQFFGLECNGDGFCVPESMCSEDCPPGTFCAEGTCQPLCEDCDEGYICADAYTFFPGVISEFAFAGPFYDCVPDCSELEGCVDCPDGFSLNWVSYKEIDGEELGECSCTPDGVRFEVPSFKTPNRSNYDLMLEQFNIARQGTKSESDIIKNKEQSAKTLKALDCECPEGTVPITSKFCGIDGSPTPETCGLPPFVDCRPAEASYTRDCATNISQTIEIKFSVPIGGTLTISDLQNCEVAEGFGGLFGAYGAIQTIAMGNSIGLMDEDENGVTDGMVFLTVEVGNPTQEVIIRSSGLEEDFVIPPCPSIDDPCNCSNPNNIESLDLFEETIIVNMVPAGVIPVLSMNIGNNFLMADGMTAVPQNTPFVSTGIAGQYELVGFTKTNTPANVQVEIGDGVSELMTTACSPCDEAIPTLGEWGLICLMLIFLIIGVVSMKQHDYQIMLVKRK